MSDDAFYQSRAWLELRYQAIKRHGGICQCCGERGSSDNPIHVDHIKSRYLHPYLALAINNLQVLCKRCNLGKGANDRTDWREEAIPRKTFPLKSSWTPYKKALACCRFISDNNLFYSAQQFVDYVITPLIGMTKDPNNQITEDEAFNCLEASTSKRATEYKVPPDHVNGVLKDLWTSTYKHHYSKKSIGSLIYVCKEAGMIPPWTQVVNWEKELGDILVPTVEPPKANDLVQKLKSLSLDEIYRELAPTQH